MLRVSQGGQPELTRWPPEEGWHNPVASHHSRPPSPEPGHILAMRDEFAARSGNDFSGPFIIHSPNSPTTTPRRLPALINRGLQIAQRVSVPLRKGTPAPPAAKQAVCAAASDKPPLLQRRRKPAAVPFPNHGPPLPLARMTPNVNPEVGLPRSGSGNQLSSAVASNLPCLQHRAMHETKPARSYDSPPHDAQRRDLARFSPASFHMQTPHAVMILARQFEPAAIATTLGSFHLGQTWPVCLESSIKLPVSQSCRDCV